MLFTSYLLCSFVLRLFQNSQELFSLDNTNSVRVVSMYALPVSKSDGEAMAKITTSVHTYDNFTLMQNVYTASNNNKKIYK